MVDQKYIGPAEYQDAIIDLIERANRIKIMLWAGDADAARDELKRVRQNYARFIESALKVKSQVSSNYRGEKSGAVIRASERVRKGWEIDYLAKAELAKITALSQETDANLFALSPVASLITKLDKRVAEETNQGEIFSYITSQLSEAEETSESAENETALKRHTVREVDESSIEHQESGFRIFKSIRDEGRWEVRGYQLDPPSIDAEKFVRSLKELPDSFVERIDSPTDATWPQRIRGYSVACHFDLTVFDPGRFILNLVLRQGEEVERWLKSILSAIAISQDNKSPKPDLNLPPAE